MFTQDKEFQQSLQNYLKDKKNCINRIQRDICELSKNNQIQFFLNNDGYIKDFVLGLSLDQDSCWYNKEIRFQIYFSSLYPYRPPKIKCISNIFHPNISQNGIVCLSITRKDWTPVYTLQIIVQSLLTLFYYPNLDDPLNQEAANAFKEDQVFFKNLLNKKMKQQLIKNYVYCFSIIYFS